ncbi:unnamed protein product [Closterium sp. Naga37s-1]|nr:unnamed protein product [Closterium sp. Naga37s-1]
MAICGDAKMRGVLFRCCSSVPAATAVMAAVATLVMHAQVNESVYSLGHLMTAVATRFLSSSPPLYWFLAHLLTSAITMHSQTVATRFLSSPPPLYWFLAHLLTSGHSKQSQSKPPSPSPRKYLPFELQVATRFLSSSPPLYWLLAHLLTSGGNSLPLLLTSSLLVPGTSPHIGKYRAL